MSIQSFGKPSLFDQLTIFVFEILEVVSQIGRLEVEVSRVKTLVHNFRSSLLLTGSSTDTDFLLCPFEAEVRMR